jgi:transcriptional regulator with XRE-family HTH domain
MARAAAPSGREISAEKAFGLVLRTARQDRGLSQEEVAGRAGYHRTYIGQLERGEKSPSLRTLFNIAVTLGVRASVLIRRVERSVAGPRLLP